VSGGSAATGGSVEHEEHARDATIAELEEEVTKQH
jgi:hypothetical protein